MVWAGTPQTFPLSMHIGMGAGEVYDMHVGSAKFGRWEYFVDGEAIQEALKLVNVAAKKELAVSKRVASILQGEVRPRCHADRTEPAQRDGAVRPIHCPYVNVPRFPRRASVGPWVVRVRPPCPQSSLLQSGVRAELDAAAEGYILRNLAWLGAKEAMLSTSRERGQAIPPQPVYQMYINESAVERLNSGHIGLINELRSVTVLFARFDAGPDGDDRRAKCQTVLAGTLEILHVRRRRRAGREGQDRVGRAYRAHAAFACPPPPRSLPWPHLGQAYEGTLRQMVTDDKGTSVLTVFGLPPWSHENDAVFGVRAGLEMRTLLQSLFSEWAIAVTTGTLFTGIVGGRTRADHTIMGEVVNSAARCVAPTRLPLGWLPTRPCVRCQRSRAGGLIGGAGEHGDLVCPA